MRIGQLARKLNVAPTQIIQYLTELGIETDKGVNTKLIQGGVDKVIERFDKSLPAEDIVTEVVEAETQEETRANEPIEPEMIDEVVAEKELVPKTDGGESEEVEEDAEPVEVIKPNLVKLQGLKVMGKIDLPEPKSADDKEEDDGDGDEANKDSKKAKYEDRNRRKTTRSNQQRKPKVLSYDEKLKREEQQLKKQLREEERARKRRKQRAYEQKLRQASPKSLKKVKRQIEEEVAPVVEKVDKPKTIWGKFKRWLNS